jgi:hypothetical protein
MTTFWPRIGCAACAAAALALTACGPASLPKASKLDAGGYSVVVVGRIALDPPFNPEFEKETGNAPFLTIDTIGNVLFMAAGPEPRRLSGDPYNMSQWSGSIEATPDQLFFIQAPRRRTWLNGAMIPLDPQGASRIYLPGGVFFDAPQDAAAIYIGTLLYHRTAFNEITSAEIVDEFDAASRAFRTKFGATASLTPSLLQIPEDKTRTNLEELQSILRASGAKTAP